MVITNAQAELENVTHWRMSCSELNLPHRTFQIFTIMNVKFSRKKFIKIGYWLICSSLLLWKFIEILRTSLKNELSGKLSGYEKHFS